MAATKSATSAETVKTQQPRGRYKVSIKGYRVMGFVDRDKAGKITIYHELPVAVHYRRPAKERDSDVQDGWHTAGELLESYGLSDIPENFRRRKRVRSDLTGALFEGAVVAADNEFEAQAKFSKLYGVKDTKNENWSVAVAPRGTTVGPYGPTKLRGLLARQTT